jgi:hypothetical protein
MGRPGMQCDAIKMRCDTDAADMPNGSSAALRKNTNNLCGESSCHCFVATGLKNVQSIIQSRRAKTSWVISKLAVMGARC